MSGRTSSLEVRVVKRKQRAGRHAPRQLLAHRLRVRRPLRLGERIHLWPGETNFGLGKWMDGMCVFGVLQETYKTCEHVSQQTRVPHVPLPQTLATPPWSAHLLSCTRNHWLRCTVTDQLVLLLVATSTNSPQHSQDLAKSGTTLKVGEQRFNRILRQ